MQCNKIQALVKASDKKRTQTLYSLCFLCYNIYVIESEVRMSEQKTYSIHIEKAQASEDIEVTILPEIRKSNQQEGETLLRTVLAGTHITFIKLLGDLPILRPATDAEREVNVYIFKDEQKDNALFKQRKQLYDIIASVFDRVLNDLFPDIDYIELARKEQQQLMFDMTAEELEMHQQEIAVLAQKIREEEPS